MSTAKSEYKCFTFDRSCTVTMKTERFEPTASGKGWKSKPRETEVETISADFYQNYVRSVPYMTDRNLGANCRAEWGYTKAGYIPYRVVTIHPFRSLKTVTTFEFD